MNGVRLLDINMLYLLWLLPVVTGVIIYGYRTRQRVLRRFIESPMLKRLTPSSGGEFAAKNILLVVAMLFIIIGLCRPAWNEKKITVKQEGRDVVFLLDVSRSMLAEDLKPNRLERAKLAIKDTVDVLNGDRIALVIFAGDAKVLCPLTMDYGFFRLMLDQVETGSVYKGGTAIGDSIRKVLSDVFDDQASKYRDIVLITDGEDHESFPVEAARKAGAQKIRLLVVGLGDENEGKRIPISKPDGTRTFLKYKGREVWTKLDGKTLREMAEATPGGRYLPVATGTIDLGRVYRDLIATAQKRKLEDRNIVKYEEKFQIFLGIALMLLFFEALVTDRKKRISKIALILFLSSICGMTAPSPGHASTTGGLVRQGNEMYKKGEYGKAESFYAQALEQNKKSPEIWFNRGNVLYKQNKFKEAEKAWQKAASLAGSTGLAEKSRFNSGNAAFRQGEQMAAKAPGEALSQFNRSAEYFRDVLAADKNFPQAVHNLELTNQRIAVLQKQLEKNKEKQEKENREKGNQKESDGRKSERQSGDQLKDNPAEPKAESKKESGKEGRSSSNQQRKSTDNQKEGAEKNRQQTDSGRKDKQKKTGKRESDSEKQKQATSLEGKKSAGEKAEDILKQERLNAARLQRMRNSGTIQVEKDW